MKRTALMEGIVFVGLLISGALLRLNVEVPNFAPVAAISLFAGFFFRSWMVAALLPWTIMGVSDYWLGAYDWQMMLVVYASLVLPIAFRPIVRRYFGSDRKSPAAVSFGGLMGSSFLASILFFLLTNFGAWLWFDMYDHTVAGLVECYVAAIPFFRYTLTGDLFFALALFGGYTLATSSGAATRSIESARSSC